MLASEPIARSLRLLAPLALYAGGILFLTWPLGQHLATHLPITNIAAVLDGYLSAWVLAWGSHALVTAPWQFPHANIYHPTPYALFYGVTGLGALPCFGPIFLASGNPTLALNLTFLGCLALTAWTLHVVVERWTGSWLGGLVAGGVFLTKRFVRWTFVPTAPVYAPLMYFPLIVYGAATLRNGRGSAPRLGALIVLQSLTDLVYVAPAVVLPLCVLAAWRLARSSTRRDGLRLAYTVIAAIGILSPVYGGYAVVRHRNPELSRQTLWHASRPMRLPESLEAPGAPTAVPGVIGALILVGAIARRLGERRRGGESRAGAWLHGALWATVGFLISLTPTVYLRGVPVRLPQFYLAQWMPALQSMRVPWRLGVASLIGIAILAGTAFGECMRWVEGAGRLRPLAKAARLGLAGIVLWKLVDGYRGTPGRGEVLPQAYPIRQAPSLGSDILAAVRGHEGPLLELPIEVAAPLPIDFQTRAMFHSIFHWRPLLNGYTSYWPAGFSERMSLVKALPDSAALAALVRETGLTTIVVHRIHLAPERWAAWSAAADRGEIRLTAVEDLDYVFEVVARPPES